MPFDAVTVLLPEACAKSFSPELSVAVAVKLMTCCPVQGATT